MLQLTLVARVVLYVSFVCVLAASCMLCFASEQDSILTLKLILNHFESWETLYNLDVVFVGYLSDISHCTVL